MGSLCFAFIAVLAGLGLVAATPMNYGTFEQKFKFRCYNRTNSNLNGGNMINGQNYVLANTLENFIHLVEKLEAANPEMILEEELYFLLNNFTIFNLDYGRDFMQDSAIIALRPNLWELETKTFNTDSVKLPFSDDEYCSLFNLLSHTINDTDAWYQSPSQYSPNMVNGAANADGEPLYAVTKSTAAIREQGVVSVKGTNQTVELSRVIAGIYLALQNASKPISGVFGSEIPELGKPNNFVVRPLYLLTIIEPLVLSFTNFKARTGLYKNGEWKYVKNQINSSPAYYYIPEICPTVYEIQRTDTDAEGKNFYSYASVRGGIDGAFMGTVIDRSCVGCFSKRTLSEVLRQYYSYQGVPTRDVSKPASFCRRQEFLDELQDYIFNLTDIYVALALPNSKSQWQDIITEVKNHFNANKNDIISLESSLDGYCRAAQSSENRKESYESTNDIIIVLDTASEDYYRKQQKIIGYMANMIDLWQYGSNVTVLANQRNSTTNQLEFMPVAASKACLACQITQRERGTGTQVKYPEVVRGVNELLKEMKKKEQSLNGAPGKVVIFFRYNEEQSTPELETEITNLRTRHMDATILGVSRDENFIKPFTGNVKYNTIITGEGDDKTVAEKLASKICKAPGALQYEFCRDGAQEAESVYKGLVSTNAKQYWSMDPKYFEKSLSNMNIKVKAARGGSIQVCHGKGSDPDSTPTNCEVLDEGVTKVFNHPNPCKGLTRMSCPALMFTIHGLMNKTETQNLQFCEKREKTERDEALMCKRLDQISFEISHEGVRCSGCSAIHSVPVLLAFALIFYSLINRLH